VRGTGAILTPRQVQVLELVGAGLSYKQVAVRLNLGHGTIKNHMQHIYGRLGVRTRIEALLEAHRLKIIKVY